MDRNTAAVTSLTEVGIELCRQRAAKGIEAMPISALPEVEGATMKAKDYGALSLGPTSILPMPKKNYDRIDSFSSGFCQLSRVGGGNGLRRQAGGTCTTESLATLPNARASGGIYCYRRRVPW
ncbi:MAG TPA: hypothetical protein VEG25_06765 [Burkholderiales bacterium]|nr:hypothetical protein [Burkholderiales bacterium]